jgi:hypothetical protein
VAEAHRKDTVNIVFISLPVMALAATLPLAAAAADRPDFYVGASLGAAVVIPKDQTVDGNRDGQARASPGLFAGARVGGLPIADGWPLSVELGWQRIAPHRVSYLVDGVSTELRADGQVAYAAAKLDVPLTPVFGLYAKLGAARSSVDGSTPPGLPVIEVKGSGTGLLWAVGWQFGFANGLLLRGEFASFGKSSSNSDTAALTFGVGYAF